MYVYVREIGVLVCIRAYMYVLRTYVCVKYMVSVCVIPTCTCYRVCGFHDTVVSCIIVLCVRICEFVGVCTYVCIRMCCMCVFLRVLVSVLVCVREQG